MNYDTALIPQADGTAGYSRGFWDVDQACEKWLRRRGLINADDARMRYSGARLRGLQALRRMRGEEAE